MYNNNLNNRNLVLPKEAKNSFHVYYQYVVVHKNRKKILKKLKKKNIHLGIVYPFPVHKMKPYKRFFKEKYGKLRKTEFFSNHIFSLPTYPSIKDSDVKKIIKEVNKLT